MPSAQLNQEQHPSPVTGPQLSIIRVRPLQVAGAEQRGADSLIHQPGSRLRDDGLKQSGTDPSAMTA